MRTEWQQEITSRYPLVFEKINNTTYIQRKDIKERTPTEQDQNPGYECLCRFISEDVKENIEVVKDVISEMEISTDGNYDKGYETGYTEGYQKGTEKLSGYEDGYNAAMILLGGKV